MQGLENLTGDVPEASLQPRRKRRSRNTRPWQEVVDEFRASGLTVKTYSEHSGISRSSITRYLALAGKAEQSGGTAPVGSANSAAAQAMAGFLRVGIVGRDVSASDNATTGDVAELILGDGIHLRLPVHVLQPLLSAMIARIGAGAR